MKRLLLPGLACFFLALSPVHGQRQSAKMYFVVSMEHPGNHYYHITLRCEGLKQEIVDFKLPVWTPGYYKIQNLPKYVVNFKAEDNNRQLEWRKITKNAWRVNCKNTNVINVSYDVYAGSSSILEPFLDEGTGFISPTGIFMYVDSQLQQPAIVTLKPCKGWGQISTGLEPVQGEVNTYYASDFDELYDCPILLGNQEVLFFKVKGIPHFVALEKTDSTNKNRFLADLAKIVESAVNVIGEIPYKHYTFIVLGEGRGGLEHRNSAAVTCNGSVSDTTNRASYNRWLSFLAHEYFHLYNVKAIRPIALGPFDYDGENYTNMLWVSEGITVYYEYLALNRAGLMSQDECLEELRQNIISYENRPGHLFESATRSSFDAWIHFFEPGIDARNTTISYYDKGCALGMLLDLKIRHETKNRKSLDDVMKTLYHKYYKGEKRGFTDDEFRMVCEAIAGVSLSEIFEYASSVEEINYAKYLNYAGLSIDTSLKEIPGKAYFGAAIQQQQEGLLINFVERGSPAWQAGLGNNDVILLADNNKLDKKQFMDMIGSRKPGEKVTLKVLQHDIKCDVEITLSKWVECSYNIHQETNADQLQSEILKGWLQ